MSPANGGTYGPTGLLPSEAFSQTWRQRKAQANRTRTPFGPWALRIPEAQSGPLDFRRFPYQEEPYLATGDLDELVVEKGTQVGFSTMMIRWALWIADEWGGTVMYVMPTEPDVTKFSAQRVAPVINGSDYLTARIAHDDPNSVHLRKIGRGFVYFVGSRAETALDSVPATALVLDEYDTLTQAHIPVAEARVGASPHPMKRRIGVPSLDGIGIDREYQGTDMRRWLVKCDACNDWQRVTMANLRWEEEAPGRFRAWRVCVKCDRPLDVTQGEWVAEHPGRVVRGYHVPRLIVPNANLGEIVKASRSSDAIVLENHHHRNLALPYEQAENRLSRAAIESCRREGIELAESYVGFNPVTMGIDQASTRGLHVRISEHLNEREKRVLFLGVVDDDEPDDDERRSAIRKLGLLMDAFNVKMAGIDHQPDGRMARSLAAAYPGRVMLVALSDNLKAPMTPIPKIEAAEQLVTVNRTIFITATFDLFRWQRNLLPRRAPLPDDYEDHLRALVRQRVQTKELRWKHRYENSGPFDWAMAELFDVVATEVWRIRLTEQQVLSELNIGQEVHGEDPTPNFNDWEGKPWEEPYRPGGALDEDPWDTDDGMEYRP